MDTSQRGRFDLYLRYTHLGGPAYLRLSRGPTRESVENRSEHYIVSELVPFSVGNFTSIFDPGDAVEYVSLVAREDAPPGVNQGRVVPGKDDQDLSWPPPRFDPTRDDQVFLVQIEYASDGTPLHASWASR